jgi:N-acetylglucosamine-6-phosphate deacetylase
VSAALVGSSLVAGDLLVDEGRIAGIGMRPAGRTGLATSGFIDAQVNGFGGVDFLAADRDEYESAGAALAATGVTAYQPTFISSPLDAYRDALAVVGGLERPGGPRLLGAHLEGPFLSPRWPGAHNPDNIVAVDPALAAKLCDAGPVRFMTVAPEVPGGLELVSLLVERGIVVSLGHSDADAAQAHAAFDRGARAVTHIFNAQRRWRPRDPGLAGAALTREGVTVQAIVDLIHTAPESAYAAFLACGRRFALTTDAIMAAGLPEGVYRLGDRAVQVAGGAARLEDGTLAGGVSTMDRSVRNLVSLGATVAQALRAASSAPARLLGRTDLGAIRIGAPADVAVLNDELRVTRTLVEGEEVFGA